MDMASNDYYPSPAPDLASILTTLAGLTSQITPHAQNQQQFEIPTSSFNQVVNYSHPKLTEDHRPINHQNVAPTLESYLPTTDQIRHISTKDPMIPKTIVDPTCILDWSSGLRCVMKTVAKHENILDEIRRLLKLQHEHEEQWWNGRSVLIEKLKAREEGQKKLDEVLKSVGGAVSSSQSEINLNSVARELQTFDLKIYKAQMQMVREMNAKLRSLGVPFFGTRSELVRPASKKDVIIKDREEMIDEADLVTLQRRMLDILEDLCNY